MEDLKKTAKNKGLEESVIFTGMRRDITDILSCIDIFVLSSIKEGLPNSLWKRWQWANLSLQLLLEEFRRLWSMYYWTPG